MNNAMHLIATHARITGARGLFLILMFSLTGCALKAPSASPSLYDFGPGRLSRSADAAPTPAPATPALRPLIVADIDASPALESNAVLYRLAYADAQQLKPYAQARWSMTPAQLVRQRLRAHLGQSRTLLNPGDSMGKGSAAPLTLRLELEEFSQLFDSPGTSVGLLRLRATVVQANSPAEQTLAQRMVVVQRPAASADAAGGVRALTLATDAAIQEIDAWLQTLAL
jgi:cholesterol transport system auxiliary component